MRKPFFKVFHDHARVVKHQVAIDQGWQTAVRIQIDQIFGQVVRIHAGGDVVDADAGGAGFGVANGEYYGEFDDGMSYNGDIRYGLSHRTYMKLARYGDAVRAYERLNEVMPGKPAAMISLVDALAMDAPKTAPSFQSPKMR